MVKIRYAELPAGLHVATEERNNCTIVYLLPGLTPQQRRAALTFARRSARIGHGPSLPAVDMAFALAADRTRMTARTIVAVLRRHPMLLLPLVAVVSGVIVVTMLSFVTVSLGPLSPATAPQRPVSGGQASHDPHGHGSSRTATRPDPTASATTPSPVTPTVSVGQQAGASGAVATASETPSAGGTHAAREVGLLCIPVGLASICPQS